MPDLRPTATAYHFTLGLDTAFRDRTICAASSRVELQQVTQKIKHIRHNRNKRQIRQSALRLHWAKSGLTSGKLSFEYEAYQEHFEKDTVARDIQVK